MAVQEFCRSPQQAKEEMKANFAGFLVESQQSIKAAIDELDRMPMTKVQRDEVMTLLNDEGSALNTVAKSSNTKQLQAAHDVLGKTGQKFAEFRVVTQPFCKAHLAAISGMVYSAIKMDEIDGYNTPDKRALPWVKYMESRHAKVQQTIPDYKSSKSQKFIRAIHNFYTCSTTTAKDTTSKSRDNSKESMVPQQNEKYRNSSYRAGKS